MVPNLADRLRILFSRPEFAANPSRALFRRLRWHLKWRLTTRPWELKFGEDMKIAVPRCGAGALIYYQGHSEPETARFMAEFLRPGMVFFDVGAHIGEYALLASRLVGVSGEVHAFEPQPDTFDRLETNIQLNGLENVRARALAVSDTDGDVDFVVRAEPSLSSIAWAADAEGAVSDHGRIKVLSTRLDTYCLACGCWPDLVKIDVEGAELRVLEGATRLLEAPPGRAPCLVFEYGPDSYVQFGYDFQHMRRVLELSGFGLYRPDRRGQLLTLQQGDSVPYGTRNLVASKTKPAGPR